MSTELSSVYTLKLVVSVELMVLAGGSKTKTTKNVSGGERRMTDKTLFWILPQFSFFAPQKP